MLPLVLDLDGTTVLTDTLVENALRVLAEEPLALTALLPTALHSRAKFKHKVAAAHALDPATLVYNEAILSLAHAAKAEGRAVYLVTAADRMVAERVAAHLGFFDGVFASDGSKNLKAETKAALLVEKFGRQKFDYAGDSAADLPVWRQARRAYVVNASKNLIARARKDCGDVVVLGQKTPALQAWRLVGRAMRLHQWAKNVLIFVPVLAAHRTDAATLWKAGCAFFAFSLCASAVYLLNDLVDLPHDRAHASKRRRPFASGALNLVMAPPLTAGLLFATLLLGLLLPAKFLAMVGVYFICTLTYSFLLKRQMVWDVVTLAGLYTIRVFAGGAATGIRVSPWLLAFAMFLFFCLAIVKRLTELTQFVRGGGGTKLKGRGYAPDDADMLRSMAASSGYMAVLVMALYVNGGDVLPLYRHPSALWALCPILLFWISRVLMLANRGLMNDDPVIFALRDRVSLLSGALGLAAILVATL
jgi:4-hydroxybenzoate polyprenyltransferase/phosphoserine phosphatase